MSLSQLQRQFQMAYHQNGMEVLIQIFYLSRIETKIRLYQ